MGSRKIDENLKNIHLIKALQTVGVLEKLDLKNNQISTQLKFQFSTVELIYKIKLSLAESKKLELKMYKK